jgi:hypothetical protein
VRRLVPLIPVLCVLSGCGDDESGFTAEQFVAAMNERGASLALGPELRSAREDAQVYALALTGSSEGRVEEHGGGSLTVTPSAEDGYAEYERCRQAASLLCYRADNIVLILEGEAGPAELAALSNALRAIAEETSD